MFDDHGDDPAAHLVDAADVDVGDDVLNLSATWPQSAVARTTQRPARQKTTPTRKKSMASSAV
jgi:hypothetical protein